ncbi:MAG: alpha/beta hydrolase [Chloroflexota bacterium]|nr:alpha/beta hydrolase [Chloroflexota bacterium]
MSTNISRQLPGLQLTDHHFTVPLDHATPDGRQITVFAREVVAAARKAERLPWLVFFQGGPGFPAPRPTGASGWIKRAVQDYRVLLLDQRGTGRSTPVTVESLRRFPTSQAVADYLRCFRADAIVQDAEYIRKTLLGPSAQWSVLGQSFGGFCVTHYLSAASQALKEAIITGGLPPLERPVDDIYRATYQRVLQKNRRYYERYPDDAPRTRAIVDYLATHEVYLPGGDPLTPRRFQQLGMALGASDGFEEVHYLLEDAFHEGGAGPELSYTFLKGVEAAQAFDTNPIYAILHEAIYCQQEASRWSAERLRREYPDFDLAPDRPVFFTGEMIYPWMFDDYRRLQPLKEAAEILAAHDAWPDLYVPTVLRKNTVPCAAAIYYDDMYVERHFSEETAETIRGIKVWVTNEYEHNGLRANGEVILSRLLDMLHGEI